MSLFTRIKSFDVYRKLPSDLTEPTVSGAIVSVASTLIMLTLFLTEVNEFFKVQTVSETFIDIERGSDKLTVNIDIHFPKLICDLVSLDTQDIMGSHYVNVKGKLRKIRLDAKNKTIGELEFRDGDNFLDLNRAQQAIQAKESCQLVGSFDIYKVPGNFHISSHAFPSITQVFQMNNMNTIDLSHRINHISFGDDSELKLIKKKFGEGVLNPLDGVEKNKTDSLRAIGVMHQYYINIVPTTYQDLSGNEFYVHQFTVNSNELQTSMLPAIFFRYDLSPVTVKYTHHKETFFRFLVQICAIIGGIFTIAGIIDAIVHKSVVKIMKKANMGKLT